MATEKQVAANRRNCLRSTGPKSARGKAKVSRNALKLGLMAQAVVVRGRTVRESGREYAELCREFHERLAPVGLLEEMLTGQIAATAWRLRRVRQAEAGEIALSVDEGEAKRSVKRPEEMFPQWGYPDDPVPGMTGSALGNEILISWLADVRAAVEREGKLTEAMVKIPCSGKPNEISSMLENIRLSVPRCPEGKDAGQHREDMKQRLLVILEEMIRQRERLRAECERRERLEERVRQSAAVLPGEETVGRIVRYESVLEKQLFRAMNQLEKLQARRAKASEDGGSRVEDGGGMRKGDRGRSAFAEATARQGTNAENEISQNKANLETPESPDLTG